jgi:uncharacterized membrane protein YbjE (DUF340 family)
VSCFTSPHTIPNNTTQAADRSLESGSRHRSASQIWAIIGEGYPMDQNIQSAWELANIPSITFLGCVTAYVFSQQKGIKSSIRFLKGFFPRRSSAFYIRVDFILSVIIGTCIGAILHAPITTEYQALAAGLGWTAAFSIIMAENPNRQASRENGRVIQ